MGKKNFKHLLRKISQKELYDQKSTLEYSFHKWKNKKEQVDDVTVLGFRLR